MIADDVDHRRERAPGVVQVGQAVGHSGAEVQQGRRGVPEMRAYPSAAPVATPSNRHSTGRMAGAASSAATKCISEVPGLAKHTSTPSASRRFTTTSAPVLSSGCSLGSPTRPIVVAVADAGKAACRRPDRVDRPRPVPLPCRQLTSTSIQDRQGVSNGSCRDPRRCSDRWRHRCGSRGTGRPAVSVLQGRLRRRQGQHDKDDPGYADHLDRDGDGIACEKKS